MHIAFYFWAGSGCGNESAPQHEALQAGCHLELQPYHEPLPHLSALHAPALHLQAHAVAAADGAAAVGAVAAAAGDVGAGETADAANAGDDHAASGRWGHEDGQHAEAGRELDRGRRVSEWKEAALRCLMGACSVMHKWWAQNGELMPEP